MKIGTIRSLHRYPVKSLQGESLPEAHLNLRGLEQDRLFAIQNPQGKFGSGKNTRRFTRIDGLLALKAFIKKDEVFIEFPDGHVISSESNLLESSLTNYFGQPLSLSREADISHFDDGPVHVITTGDLLRANLAEIDICRFRPNLVIESEIDLSEENLNGKTLTIGSTQLKISHQTERCRMVSLAQNGLHDAPYLLKQLVNGGNCYFGRYVEVTVPGSIRQDDEVFLND
ncbi:hypothetical protein BTA51_01975 [Hahella sp. CCB-MM4]|uniref:MOSC domain-containing protein n=1 Tax=Hahella sp. (strain CCB-MM4) TaxID=1926491 RepID=UPI000B9C7578|nr:MOSC N-terminal beta barrel domain-containing protein [Hahella sp. CCB-MM4]OZG75176.1 hypothetical protein BTA51_01975 [Hahella sp. CCB-MM4]